MYQVHLELVNQSVCDTILNPNPDVQSEFDPELMVCAGDVENGGRDTCDVSQISKNTISHNFLESLLAIIDKQVCMGCEYEYKNGIQMNRVRINRARPVILCSLHGFPEVNKYQM